MKRLSFISYIILFAVASLLFLKVSLAPFFQQFLLSQYDIHIEFDDYSFDSITTISFENLHVAKPGYFDFYTPLVTLTPGRKSKGFFRKQWILHSLMVKQATLKLQPMLFEGSDEESRGPLILPDFPLDTVDIFFDSIEIEPTENYRVIMNNVSLNGKGKYQLQLPEIAVKGKSLSSAAHAACNAQFTAEFNKYDFMSIECIGTGVTIHGDVGKEGSFVVKSYLDLSEIGEVFDFDIAGNVTVIVEPYFNRKEPELHVELFLENFHWDLVHLWDIAAAAKINPRGIQLENLTLYHEHRPIFTAEAAMAFPLTTAKGTVQLDRFDFRDTMLRFETTGMVDFFSTGTIVFEADLKKFYIKAHELKPLRADGFLVSLDEPGDILALPGSQFVTFNLDVTAEKLRLLNAVVTTANMKSHVFIKNSWFTFGDIPKFHIPIIASSRINMSDIGHVTGFQMTGKGAITTLVSGEMENPDVIGTLDLTHLSFAGFPADSGHITITLKDLLLSVMVDRATKGSATTKNSLTTIEFTDPVTTDFNINNFSGLAKDVFSIFGTTAPLTGTGAFAVHGVWKDGLKKLEGSLRVEALSLYGTKIVDELKLSLKTEGDRILLHNSFLKRGHTSFSITGGMNPEDFSLDISGEMTAFSIKDIPLEQTLSLVAPRASYTIKGPIPDVTVQAALFAGNVTLADIPFGNFSGNIEYEPTTEHVEFVGNVGDDIAMKVSMENFDTATLHGSLKVDQFNLKLGEDSVLFSMDAEGKLGDISATISDVTARFGVLTLRDKTPISIHGKFRHLIIESGAMGTEDDRLSFSGELIDFVPHLEIEGKLSPKTINRMLGSVVSHATGSVDMKIKLDDEMVNGSLSFHDLGFTLTQLNLPFKELSGELSIEDNKWDVTGLTGKVGGGAVSLHGDGGLFPFLASELILKVTSATIHLDATGPITFSSDLMAQFGNGVEEDTISGSIILSRLDYQKDISLSSVLVNSIKSTNKLEKAHKKESVFNPRLNIEVLGHNNLSIDTDLITAHLSAKIAVTGRLHAPIARGNLTLLDGVIYFQQQKFELSRGMVTLEDGIARINPFLDVSGKATAIDQSSDQETEYKLTLSVEGYPLKEDGLIISLESSPQLEENKIFSLLLWGTTGGTTDMGQASTLAIATVSNMIGITSQIKRNFQFSRFEIAPRYSEVDDKTVLKIIAVKEIYDDLFLELESNPTDMNDQQMGLRYEFENSDVFLVWRNKTLLNAPYGSIGFQMQLNYIFE